MTFRVLFRDKTLFHTFLSRNNGYVIYMLERYVLETFHCYMVTSIELVGEHLFLYMYNYIVSDKTL